MSPQSDNHFGSARHHAAKSIQANKPAERAHSQVAAAEDTSDADLEALNTACHKRVTETLESLARRRAARVLG
jgi:hypothetical protein